MRSPRERQYCDWKLIKCSSNSVTFLPVHWLRRWLFSRLDLLPSGGVQCVIKTPSCHASKLSSSCCCGGFFLACEDFGRMLDHSFPACAFFICFFPEVEISSRTLIPNFMPGSVHGGSGSWDDCDRMFPDKLLVSSFPNRFHDYAWTAAWPALLRLRWAKGVCVFRCNLPPVLLTEWPGSFTCHCGNKGGGTDIELDSAHKVNSGGKKVNSREEISPAAPAGIRTRNFSITSPALLPTSYPGWSYCISWLIDGQRQVKREDEIRADSWGKKKDCCQRLRKIVL